MLLAAIRDGVSLLTWENDAFAFADSFDEGAGRYRGLRTVTEKSHTLKFTSQGFEKE